MLKRRLICLSVIVVVIFAMITGYLTIQERMKEWYETVFYFTASIVGVMAFFKTFIEFANELDQLLDRAALSIEKHRWINLHKTYIRPILATLTDWEYKGYPVDILEQHIRRKLMDSSIPAVERREFAERIISELERFKLIDKRGDRVSITNEGKEVVKKSRRGTCR